MRLKSSIWVSAYLRRCQIEGAIATLRRRGAEEAGAIFIKISKLDGTGVVYGPAPQTAFNEDATERKFAPGLASASQTDAELEAYLARQIKFDPDVWIVEVEDRQGRHFLDDQLAF